MSAVLLTVVGDIKVDDKVVSRLIYAKVASAESNDEIMKLIRKILVAQLQKVKITIKMLLHYINKQGFDVINSLFFIFLFQGRVKLRYIYVDDSKALQNVPRDLFEYFSKTTEYNQNLLQQIRGVCKEMCHSSVQWFLHTII